MKQNRGVRHYIGGIGVTHNKPKPDDRSDNVEKLQDMVQNTIENIEEAQESMEFSNAEERQRIQAKNERREESIAAMREEIKDEAADRENGYQ
ncbi:small acid-soluble spore protein Tlp [Bacillus sp. HNG]|nr:small acid-soluble spore protein Tlp [Bacillus sp. HNG]